MQKIKYNLLNRIIKEPLTSLEIDFLLYLCKICNEIGEATGIYYNDMMQALKCCKASFYELRDSLTSKGFIIWSKNYSADIDIILPDNDFTNLEGEIEYRDYLNINIGIFADEEFYNLRAGAKKIALELLKRSSAGRTKKLKYRLYNHYRTIADILHIRVRMVKEYFRDIKKWIHTGKIIDEGKYYHMITILAKTTREPVYTVTQKGKAKQREVYPEHYYHRHYIQVQCRREHIEVDERNLTDTAGLIQQYAKKAKAQGKNILNIIVRAIQNVKNNVLNSISIHKAVQNLLAYTGAK